MATRTKPHDEQSTNWIRGTLALQLMKEGLEDFVHNETKTLHERILQTTGLTEPTCNNACTASDIQKDSKGKLFMTCKACNRWLQMITENQHTGELFPENCNPQLWPSVPWEIFKIYLPSGYCACHSVKDADIVAILTLFKNCILFSKNSQIGRQDLVKELFDSTVLLLHSEKCKMDSEDLQNIVEKCLQFIQGFAGLSELDSRKIEAAVNDIKVLQSKEMQISSVTTPQFSKLMDKTQSSAKKMKVIATKLESLKLQHSFRLRHIETDFKRKRPLLHKETDKSNVQNNRSMQRIEELVARVTALEQKQKHVQRERQNKNERDTARHHGQLSIHQPNAMHGDLPTDRGILSQAKLRSILPTNSDQTTDKDKHFKTDGDHGQELLCDEYSKFYTTQHNPIPTTAQSELSWKKGDKTTGQLCVLPKKSIEDEVYNKSPRMMHAYGKELDVSNRLFDVLEEIGATEKRRTFGRKLAELIELLWNAGITKQKQGVYLAIHGDLYEGSFVPGLDYQISVILFTTKCEVNIKTQISIQSVQLVPSKDEQTHPGYTKLILVGGDQSLNNDRFSGNIRHPLTHQSMKYDNMGKMCLENTRHHTAPTGIALFLKNVPDYVNRWIVRQRKFDWPTETQISSMKEMGILLVGSGHEDSDELHLEWKYLFILQERLLMSSLNPTQYKTYILLKMVKETFLKQSNYHSVISTYHLKTCLLHAVENTPNSFWTEQNLPKCVLVCLTSLFQYIRHKCCPHYFIKDINLFDKLEIARNSNFLLQTLKEILSLRENIFNVLFLRRFGSRLIVEGQWFCRYIFALKEQESLNMQNILVKTVLQMKEIQAWIQKESFPMLAIAM